MILPPNDEHKDVSSADVSVGTVAVALNKLTDAQVFSRDAEDYSAETLEDAIARLQKIVARQRKARADAAEVVALTVNIKKANAASAKTKAKKASKLLEQKI